MQIAIEKMEFDAASNNKESLMSYMFDKDFLTNLSNDPEKSTYYFTVIGTSCLDYEDKKKIFEVMYRAISPQYIETILGDSSVTFHDFYTRYMGVKTIVNKDNIDTFLERFQRDTTYDCVESLLRYYFDPYFLLTLSNNVESSQKNIRRLAVMSFNEETRVKVFLAFYNSITELNKERFLNSASFEKFYNDLKVYEKSMKMSVYQPIRTEEEREQERLELEEEKVRQNSQFILGSILADMLTSDFPNFRNMTYYYLNTNYASIEEYYDDVIKLLFDIRHTITIGNLIHIFATNTTYLYYFFDEEEFPKYFKALLETFDGTDSIKMLKIYIKRIYHFDYDLYRGFYYLMMRLSETYNIPLTEHTMLTESELEEVMNNKEEDFLNGNFVVNFDSIFPSLIQNDSGFKMEEEVVEYKSLFASPV